MFQNRVLRRLFGSKKDEVTREWIGAFYAGFGRGSVREREKPLGRSRLKWENNIKLDLQEVGYGEWTGFIWLRLRTVGGGGALVNAVMNLRPQNASNILSSREPVSFSRSTLHHGVQLHSFTVSVLVEGEPSNYARPLP